MMPRRSLPRLLLNVLCVLLTVLAAAAVGAWLAGRVVSDRWTFGQWLLWIPTPAMLPAVLLGLLGALGPGRRPRFRRRRLWSWIAAAAAIAVFFGFFEHRLLRGAPDPGRSVHVAYWNMTHEKSAEDRARHVEAIIDLLGDVTILLRGWGIVRHHELLESLPEDVTAFHLGKISVFSRLPIIEMRQILARERIEVYLLRIDCTETLGRTLVIHAIDLPSDPHLPRMEVARQARRLLAQANAPPPDIVVGDCNMTRGSAALALLTPGLRHAFDEGGHGYAASFHRAFPLYHIDHVLLDESLRCTRYDLVDPGVGRHHAQAAWIASRP